MTAYRCFLLLLLMYRCIFTQRSLRLATSARNRRKRRVEDDTVSSRNCTEKCLHGFAPRYPAELCVTVADVTGRRNLRSATRGLLNFPPYNMTSYGRRAFSYAGPHAWNSLPEHLRQTTSKRQTTSIELFKRSLKTFLFGQISLSAH